MTAVVVNDKHINMTADRTSPAECKNKESEIVHFEVVIVSY